MNERPWYLNLFNQELLKNMERMQTMSDQLKTCPFCGGKAILVTLSSCRGYVACIGDCGFKSADFWDEPMTGKERAEFKWNELATKSWNRRQIDQEQKGS